MVGKPGEKVSAAEFRAECRKYAKTQIEAQKTDFIRLGVLGDCGNTLPDHGFWDRSQHHPLHGQEIVENGHLQKGSQAGALVY